MTQELSKPVATLLTEDFIDLDANRTGVILATISYCSTPAVGDLDVSDSGVGLEGVDILVLEGYLPPADSWV